MVWLDLEDLKYSGGIVRQICMTVKVNSISFCSLEFHFLLNREVVDETDSLE